MADEQKMSEFDEKFTALIETDYIPILVDDGLGGFTNGICKKSILLGYKSYVATLTQSGTSAPTANELKNDFGSSPSFARTGGGAYTFTLTGLLTELKTAVFTGQNGTDVFYAQKEVGNNNVVLLGAPGDDILQNSFLEIRVYY